MPIDGQEGMALDGLSISVIRYVKDVSKMLAPPCVGIAYFLQSGGPEWKFHPYFVLPNQMPWIHSLVPLPDFLWLFFVKVFLGSFTFIIGNVFITFLVNMALSEFKSGEEWLLIGRGIIRILLLAFALFGIFFQGKYEELTEINTFWYVACVIWGLSISFDSSGSVQPVNHPPPC
jgi:hypothetical protein